MKKITALVAIMSSFFSFSQNNDLGIAIKEKIVAELHLLNGIVSESLIEQLENELKTESHDSRMCFCNEVSHDAYIKVPLVLKKKKLVLKSFI
ncbi:hypothetical protein N9355_10170 [Crocinitomicaceae bacterium]|nr:hypothetical protein [Crocinitomicaceae bacterium]